MQPLPEAAAALAEQAAQLSDAAPGGLIAVAEDERAQAEAQGSAPMSITCGWR